MTIVFDIGNTRTKVGRFRTDDPIPAVEVLDWEGLTEAVQSLPGSARAGISSVVPRHTERLVSLLAEQGIAEPFQVRPGIRLPFEMAYKTPETLGNDRLAAAAGAWMLYRQPGEAVIVVDAGTAVTYEVVSSEGRYLGGAIAPGPDLAGRALGTGTAQLPSVRLSDVFQGAVGDSTVDAIRSGLHWGFVDSVSGMVARLSREVGGEPVVVFTGGWADWLTRQMSAAYRIDRFLVLRGVRLLMELHTE